MIRNLIVPEVCFPKVTNEVNVAKSRDKSVAVEGAWRNRRVLARGIIYSGKIGGCVDRARERYVIPVVG